MNPLLIIGAVLGLLSFIFLIAYLSIKNKKEILGFDRNIKDSVILKRLLKYAKPYYKSFIFVLFLYGIRVATIKVLSTLYSFCISSLFKFSSFILTPPKITNHFSNNIKFSLF